MDIITFHSTDVPTLTFLLTSFEGLMQNRGDFLEFIKSDLLQQTANNHHSETTTLFNVFDQNIAHKSSCAQLCGVLNCASVYLKMAVEIRNVLKFPN